MATGGASTLRHRRLLWDRDNKNEQVPVCDSRLSDVLREARVKLKRTLCVDDLWDHLDILHVLRHTDVERLTHNAARPEVVERLVNHLARSPTWQFHGLMRACVLTGQEHVIGQIGLIADDYIIAEENPVGFPGASYQESASSEPCTTVPTESVTTGSSYKDSEGLSSLLWRYWSLFINWIYSWLVRGQLQQATKDHSHNCKRQLMRRNLYDLGDSSAVKIVDVAKCYIKLNTQQEGEDGNLQEISERDIMRCLPGETSLNVIRMYGSPGAGKTALARHIVYDWSLDVLNRLSKSHALGHFTTMVYVPCREISSTVEKAIEEHLWCRAVDKQALLWHVNNGDGSGLVLDAIDEVRDPVVMNNIRKYIKDRQTSGHGPRVLVTARTDLCELESSLFDRFLVVKGFSVPQGMEYIRTYLHGEPRQKVLEYVQAHEEKLYAVLTNPLRLHIFCALVSEGELNLDHDADFSLYKLLVLLEQFLIRREGKLVTKAQLHSFYAMCMFGLIHGLREFSEEVLNNFDIVEGCLVFLIRTDKERATGRQVTYSFPHEMIYEFFAARYIETLSLESKKSLLLSVCAKSAFRNLQKIMFEVILQQELHQQELLQTMLRAILILQHKQPEATEAVSEAEKASKALFDELLLLKAVVRPPESAEKLWLEHQEHVHVTDVNDTWNRINSVFDNYPGGLKGLNWYNGLEDGVLGHATECLQACPSKQRELLAKTTIEHLLPYDYKDAKGHHYVCAAGLSRWGEVVVNTEAKTIDVNAWCMEDAKDVLHHVRLATVISTQCKQNTFKSITLNINMYQSLWGQPPSSASRSDVFNQWSDELQHWSKICKSLHSVCAVGSSRFSKVVFNNNPKTVEVHAWCLEDVKEVLRQVRLSDVAAPRLHNIDSLTLNINKYRDLWGQPPDMSEVSIGLSAELIHWSGACKSYHFVCGVGTSRWSEVVINTEQNAIGIDAWSLQDAKEAAHQVRLSDLMMHISEHTFKPITLNINMYRSLWGKPPSSAFTLDVCNNLTTELQHWSDTCNSHQFVCAVGTSRCSEVVINKEEKTITVQAWCAQDAKDALHQVRLWDVISTPDYKPITNINKYQDMWGQPPSSAFTPDVCKGLTAELQNWSNICNSWQFVYNVGAARYAEVVFDGVWMRVKAWCVEDATQVVYKLRTSRSRLAHIGSITAFDFYINLDHSVWGEPPSTAFSQDTWRELFVEVELCAHMWKRDCVRCITLSQTTPLHGLLQSCNPREWYVFYGTIDLEDLYRLLHAGQLEHVMSLCKTNIVVPDRADKDGLRHRRDELAQAEDACGGRLLDEPHFVTQTGAEYQWGDEYT